MTPPLDRRFELRRPANSRVAVLAPGMELSGLITDESSGGLRLRLERSAALPKTILVVDVAAGQAIEATVAWQKGVEAGLKRSGAHSLRGLVPGRLTQARDVWRRLGGR